MKAVLVMAAILVLALSGCASDDDRSGAGGNSDQGGEGGIGGTGGSAGTGGTGGTALDAGWSGAGGEGGTGGSSDIRDVVCEEKACGEECAYSNCTDPPCPGGPQQGYCNENGRCQLDKPECPSVDAGSPVTTDEGYRLLADYDEISAYCGGRSFGEVVALQEENGNELQLCVGDLNESGWERLTGSRKGNDFWLAAEVRDYPQVENSHTGGSENYFVFTLSIGESLFSSACISSNGVAEGSGGQVSGQYRQYLVEDGNPGKGFCFDLGDTAAYLVETGDEKSVDVNLPNGESFTVKMDKLRSR